MNKNPMMDLERSFFETTPLGVYQTTRDGVIIAANRTFLHMLGITKQQSSKINLNQYDLGALYPRKKFIEELEKKNQVVGLEYEWKKRDGKIIYVRENARAVRGKNKVLYYEGTIEDVTDRKKVELELLDSQKKLEDAQKKLTFLNEMSRRLAKSMDYGERLTQLAKMLVPHMADWCFVDSLTDEDTLITMAMEHTNPKKLKLAQALKKTHTPDPKHSNGLWNVLETGTPIFIPTVTDQLIKEPAYDNEHIRILYSIGLCSLMVFPLIARGKTIGVITLANSEKNRIFTHADFLFAEHISKRAATFADNARLYKEAQEEEKRRDHFLGIASHELKNTLAGIKSYTQLLQRKLKDNEKESEYLQRIDLNTNRMKRLMDDLIDLTKLKSHKLTLFTDTFEIVQLIHEVVDEFRILSKTHTITINGRTPVFIVADRIRIRQVLTNLIKNAIKYSPEAKRIIVSIDKKNGSIEVGVKDFGVGIPKKDLRKIFNLFYRVEDNTTNTHGLGVGLYISNEIIKMHKGSMNVKSILGKGSTFTFTIPVKEVRT